MSFLSYFLLKDPKLHAQTIQKIMKNLIESMTPKIFPHPVIDMI